MITTQQTQQAIPLQQGPLNEQRKSQLKANIKAALAKVQARREAFDALRVEVAKATADVAEAQEMLKAARMKEGKVRNDFTMASDAHGSAQSELNLLQGQLQQLESQRIGQ
jgi:chromosome segregation ATPase